MPNVASVTFSVRKMDYGLWNIPDTTEEYGRVFFNTILNIPINIEKGDWYTHMFKRPFSIQTPNGIILRYSFESRYPKPD